MTQSHWAKSHAFWLVLMPLALTVIAGVTTILIANRADPYQLVPGEFAKRGRVMDYNQAMLERSRAAAGGAEGRIDTVANRLELRLRLAELPDSIQAHFVHPTIESKDRRVTMARAGDGFAASLPVDIPDRGELHIAPENASWRIVARIDFEEPLLFSALRRTP